MVARFCPICGSKLCVEEKDGERKLVCARHGEMRVYLAVRLRLEQFQKERDVGVSGEVGKACAALGVVDLEAC